MVVYAVLAIIIGYLLGSVPTAYIITRLVTGNDIRRMGGGNVGGLNIYREVGVWPAFFVGIIDLCKGAAAVSIAYWLLGLSPFVVMLTGLMAVIGHNWMVWLKFSGGKGMGATIGVLSVLLPVYGFWPGLVIIFGVIIVPYLITRNIALAMGLGLLSLPFITWLGMDSGTGTVIAIILGLVVGLKFLPTARTAWVRAEGKKDGFFFDHWRREGKKE
ncbi:glycerol-3-phosphate acyltransferase [Chloroflexota bacterium]